MDKRVAFVGYFVLVLLIASNVSAASTIVWVPDTNPVKGIDVPHLEFTGTPLFIGSSTQHSITVIVEKGTELRISDYGTTPIRSLYGIFSYDVPTYYDVYNSDTGMVLATNVPYGNGGYSGPEQYLWFNFGAVSISTTLCTTTDGVQNWEGVCVPSSVGVGKGGTTPIVIHFDSIGERNYYIRRWVIAPAGASMFSTSGSRNVLIRSEREIHVTVQDTIDEPVPVAVPNCWMQDTNVPIRVASLDLNWGRPLASQQGNGYVFYDVNTNARLTITNAGSFPLYDLNKTSTPLHPTTFGRNYLDVFDNTSRKVIATNDANLGPATIAKDMNYCAAGGSVCSYTNGVAPLYMPLCAASKKLVGQGLTTNPALVLDFNTNGEYDFNVRVWVVSPAGVNKDTPTDVNEVKIASLQRIKVYVHDPSNPVADENACWVQDTNSFTAVTSIDLNWRNTLLGVPAVGYDYNVRVNAILDINALGNFAVYKNYSWTPSLEDIRAHGVTYFDVFDNTLGKVIATNTTNALGGYIGPKKMVREDTNFWFCSRALVRTDVCTYTNGVPSRSSLVCDKSALTIGEGASLPLSISFTTPGVRDISIRAWGVSPAGVDANTQNGSDNVSITTIKRIKVQVTEPPKDCWMQDTNATIDTNSLPLLWSGETQPVNASSGKKYDFNVPLHIQLWLPDAGSFPLYDALGESTPLNTTVWGNNYLDVVDTSTGKVIASSGTINNGSYSGPIALKRGGKDLNYCAQTRGPVCFYANGVPPAASCSISSLLVGNGTGTPLIVDFNKLGAWDLNIRVWVVSPAGASVNSTSGTNNVQIKTIRRLSVFVNNLPVQTITPVTLPRSGLMVLAQQTMRHVNYYSNTGTNSEEFFFTLLNKSGVDINITNYQIKCSGDVTCAINPLYRTWRIRDTNMLIIDGNVTYAANKLPFSFAITSLDVNYVDANNNHSTASSLPMQFQAGLLAQQNFQVRVTNDKSTQLEQQTPQAYCIDANGVQGSTGSAFVPKVNLYFGGNEPASITHENPIIGINECSSLDYNTGAVNQNAVYCSQREFLVQLAEHLGVMDATRKSMQSSYLTSAQLAALQAQDARALNFSANLRAQSITDATIVDSATRVATLAPLFSSLGLQSSTYDTGFTKFNKLFQKVLFVQTVQGGVVASKILEPGVYSVRISVTEKEPLTVAGAYLFTPDGNVNAALTITVYLEKTAAPSYDWFFYRDTNTDSFAELFESPVPPVNPTAVTTNVTERGRILLYTQQTSGASVKSFYKTMAYPFFVKITDFAKTGAVDTNFTVTNFGPSTVFSYWSGFASSLGEGCQTTSCTPPNGSTVLPYRVPDMQRTGGFMFKDFSCVARDSNIFLQTVVYVPTNAVALGITSPFAMYSVNGALAGQVSLTPAEVTDSITTLKELFDGIRAEKVCVASTASAQAKKWDVFWNQEKLVQELATSKSKFVINPICAQRSGVTS